MPARTSTEPLTAAPAPITPQQRKEAGVDAKPKTAEEKAAEKKASPGDKS